MSGIDDAHRKGFLPFDNSTLRARLAELPLRTTSIEMELRALMAERDEAETNPKRKKSSRWD